MWKAREAHTEKKKKISRFDAEEMANKEMGIKLLQK